MTRLWSFDSAGASHAGCVREVNEDAWLAHSEAGIFAVADGMGGHQRGDTASRMVIEALAALPPAPDPRTLRAQVEAALVDVDRGLQPSGAGDISGSTVVVLLICGRYFAVLWAGDSRLYRAGSGGFQQMTRDHNMAQELVDNGALTQEAARTHRLANRVTRAVGTEPDLMLEGTQGELTTGDVFLLCSDGLTRYVTNAEIQVTLEAMEPKVAADHLVALTLARGAADNVTAVVLRVCAVEDAAVDGAS
jgi:serine/threonine protein phosphatase PrpC